MDQGALHRSTGLLIGLDASGWDTSPEGYRVSTLVEGVTARRVRELGGTGGKIMVYFRSDRPEANRENLATLRRVVEDFAAEVGQSAAQRRLPDPGPIDPVALGHAAGRHAVELLGPPPHR